MLLEQTTRSDRLKLDISAAMYDQQFPRSIINFQSSMLSSADKSFKQRPPGVELPLIAYWNESIRSNTTRPMRAICDSIRDPEINHHRQKALSKRAKPKI